MNGPVPSDVLRRKIAIVRKARRIWDGFEDAAQHHVTTDGSRWFRNQDYWERFAPQMRDHLARLSSDLNRISSNATFEMTFFLGAGPLGIDNSVFQAKFEFGRSRLIELEGRYRQLEEQSMEAERRRILSYLAQQEERRPSELIEADEVAEALGIDARRTRRQLRLLGNDGQVELAESWGDDVAAVITEEGHRFLEEGPRVSRVGQIEIHIGQMVMGDNLGVQASGDRQVVIQQQEGDLAQIAPLVEALIEAVNSSPATVEQKQDAALDATQLLLEARKAKPNKESLLQRVQVIATWAQALSLGPTAAAIVDRIHDIIQAVR
jgi:DNA-binding transcriptional ArsR family regulator